MPGTIELLNHSMYQVYNKTLQFCAAYQKYLRMAPLTPNSSAGRGLLHDLTDSDLRMAPLTPISSAGRGLLHDLTDNDLRMAPLTNAARSLFREPREPAPFAYHEGNQTMT